MKQKEILFIVLSSFLLAVAWVGFNIYHSAVSSTISEAQNIQILPINPRFDTKAFENLKKRKIVAPIYESTTSAVPTPPQASPTPNQNQTEQATLGGNFIP